MCYLSQADSIHHLKMMMFIDKHIFKAENVLTVFQDCSTLKSSDYLAKGSGLCAFLRQIKFSLTFYIFIDMPF